MLQMTDQMNTYFKHMKATELGIRLRFITCRQVKLEIGRFVTIAIQKVAIYL